MTNSKTKPQMYEYDGLSSNSVKTGPAVSAPATEDGGNLPDVMKVTETCSNINCYKQARLDQ